MYCLSYPIYELIDQPLLDIPTSLNRTNYFNFVFESNRKAMNRNWSNQKANPALKTKAGNK